MKSGWIRFLILCLLTACSPSSPTGGEDSSVTGEHPPRQRGGKGVQTLAEGLDVPWSMIRDGDRLIISERGGAIVTLPVEGGEIERDKVSLRKKVVHEGEGGFLGLAKPADAGSDGEIYAYHTYREAGRTYNRVVTLKETGSAWRETGEVIGKIPGGFIHNGGRIAFGPDGKLYVTTGEAGKEANAPDRASLGGKILRLNPDGSIPGDNPFPDSPVWSYGHRNSQGLAWDGEGVLYAAEHGPSGVESGYDEINRIEKGKNYGWPTVTGDGKKAGITPPLFHSRKDTWAPSGLAHHDGKLYAAGLRGQQIRVFSPADRSTRLVFDGEGRLRDIQVFAGEFFVLTNNTDGRGSPGEKDDRLLRLQKLPPAGAE